MTRRRKVAPPYLSTKKINDASSGVMLRAWGEVGVA
jgi:hypothetical protein